ncbi:hypothetical protein CPB84DRAFT_1854699 [Gymnopilus junonius]|uniref:Uncharacterized protein n=1 Tax=Gymnopilus junonius TaxID=109634 RepID=A0A9P5NAJ5_GYMJU|nr:hypothetical protein CPB84DRAFT_1854699 [Gymnopilus junonius]
MPKNIVPQPLSEELRATSDQEQACLSTFHRKGAGRKGKEKEASPSPAKRTASSEGQVPVVSDDNKHFPTWFSNENDDIVENPIESEELIEEFDHSVDNKVQPKAESQDSVGRKQLEEELFGPEPPSEQLQEQDLKIEESDFEIQRPSSAQSSPHWSDYEDDDDIGEIPVFDEPKAHAAPLADSAKPAEDKDQSTHKQMKGKKGDSSGKPGPSKGGGKQPNKKPSKNKPKKENS